MRLSKRCLDLIEELHSTAEHCAQIAARIEAEDPTLPDFYESEGRTAQRYLGLRDGKHSAIESLLMNHDAYAGFSVIKDPETGGEWHYYNLRKAQ